MHLFPCTDAVLLIFTDCLSREPTVSTEKKQFLREGVSGWIKGRSVCPASPHNENQARLPVREEA